MGARLDHGQIAYQSKFFAHNAKKIIVDVDVNEIHKLGIDIEYKVDLDCKIFLNELLTKINEIDIDTSKWLTHCKKTYEKYPICLPEYYKQKDFVNNYVFIEELSKHLPENSLIVPGSSGACSEVTMQAIKIKPGTRIFNSEGLGSMGFGIPAAIGACLAADKQETICIDGDGGFDRVKGWCLSYGRDRGESNVSKKNGGYDELITSQDVDYVYIFDGDYWECHNTSDPELINLYDREKY